MKRYNFIICVFFCLYLVSCKKENEENNIISDPQLIARLDSLLQAVGASSYVDLLTGKLEGNFSFYSHYGSYHPNCPSASIPFKINTQLSGIVSTDTTYGATSINAGDLYINNIIISPDPVHAYYTVAAFTATSNALDQVYGTQATLKLIKNDTLILQTHLYIPKNIVMKGIDCATGMYPDHALKAGFKINWNIDYQNSNGVVIQMLGKYADGIERYSYVLVRDNGVYTFTEEDLSMYPKEKNPFGIEIKLMRGNFAILRGSDNRKYNFNFITTCNYFFRQ